MEGQPAAEPYDATASTILVHWQEEGFGIRLAVTT